MYSQLAGAYNLRNAYGAVFSHGPVLTKDKERLELLDSVAKYGLCENGSLLRAFKLDYKPVSVILESVPADSKNATWKYKVRCP